MFRYEALCGEFQFLRRAAEGGGSTVGTNGALHSPVSSRLKSSVLIDSLDEEKKKGRVLLRTENESSTSRRAFEAKHYTGGEDQQGCVIRCAACVLQ